jgi:carbon-monoxide dehydrogenase medium subunit
MKPAAFDYAAPATLAEAIGLLAAHGDEAKLLAGGQSLVPAMNFRLARPGMLIDLNGVAGLDFLRETPGALHIGALTRHARFHRPVCDGPLGRLLARVVANIAHYPIRQRGTFGGSLCHADPASEWCLVAATLDAVMVVQGPEGAREIAAADFFRGTFTTALAPDEILTEVRLPRLAEGWGTGFCEFSRRKGDFALAMALAAIRIEGGRIAEARLGLGAVADHARRMPEVEAVLVGQPATAETFARAAAAARDNVDPSADIHGSAEYRRDLAGTMVARALAEAAAA